MIAVHWPTCRALISLPSFRSRRTVFRSPRDVAAISLLPPSFFCRPTVMAGRKESRQIVSKPATNRQIGRSPFMISICILLLRRGKIPSSPTRFAGKNPKEKYFLKLRRYFSAVGASLLPRLPSDPHLQRSDPIMPQRPSNRLLLVSMLAANSLLLLMLARYWNTRPDTLPHTIPSAILRMKADTL